MSDSIANDYASLTTGAGFVVLNDWSFVRLTGADRQSFFHNFCTNEIKQLPQGQFCEAFVLNAKGKILGYIHALAGPDDLLLSGPSRQSETLIRHLDQYVIREDVELIDATEELSATFVCGPLAEQALGKTMDELPDAGQFLDAEISNTPVRVATIGLAGTGYLCIVPTSSLKTLETALTSCGIRACSLDALQIVRIESKTPWFGTDVDESNLPQELQRDEQAISFNKGCYLGQETVARIDARGRVNQLLVGFEFNGPPPAVGHQWTKNEKPAGRITSLALSPADGKHIGLGYVRRAFKDSGTEIGNAVVQN